MTASASSTPTASQPRKRLDLLLFAVVTIVLLVHLPHIPLWMTPLIPAGLIWRFQHDHGRWALPPKWLLAGLTLLAGTAVFLQFHSVWGREPGLALLVVATVLKLLESRQARDHVVLLLLGFFLIVTLLLFSQAFWMLALVLALFWLLLAAWIGQTVPTGTTTVSLAATPVSTIRMRLRHAAALTLAGLPVAIILFLFFPRPPDALWGSHQPGASPTTGLSDQLRPGSFERLGQDPAVAFRVQFDGSIVDPTKRYWRVLVMNHYDGRQWNIGPAPATAPDLRIVPESKTHYTITLEPTQRRWLPALGMPIESPPQTRLDNNLTLKSLLPVEDRFRYALTSATDYLLQPQGLRPRQQQRDLSYPSYANPRLQNLARQWRGLPAETIRDRALDYFRRHGFRYTLSPGRLPENDAMDAFLFDTRRGYCEHYASAFALLMRAAGVPARVVTGYQGGEINGTHLLVRQSDAHAWDEIWVHGKGWVRVDPTSVVAPERITTGVADAVRNDTALPDSVRRVDGVGRSLGLFADRLENGWNQWVLGYSADTQIELLHRLGLRHLGIFGMTLLALVLTGLAWWLSLQLLRHMTRKGRDDDPLTQGWSDLEDVLAQRGLKRIRGETLQQFVARCRAALPDHDAELKRVERLFSRALYGPRPAQMQIDRCLHAARDLARRLQRERLKERLGTRTR